MKHQEFYFTCHKQQLFGQYWEPQQLKGIVVLVHGMGEHSGRYSASVVPELIDRGFGVLGFDHFGHGHSEGKRGHCPSYQAVLDSVDGAIEKAVEVFGKTPLFLYGHSMGGNVVLNYAMRRKPRLNGLVASSPYLKLAFKVPAWKMTFGKIFNVVYPSITLSNGLDETAITRDPLEVKKYKTDPLMHDKVSPVFTFPFLEAGDWAIEKSHTLGVPTLVMHGTEDRITDHKASIRFANEAPGTTLKLFEGGYHELHNDLNKKEMISFMADWLSARL